ncbi:Coiled-coil domain-containing protein 61, partial [Symbiodinium microadriaticum]
MSRARFDVFVRMLLSALAQEQGSDSVYLDVLTARDLEMLRRHANPEAPPAAPATTQPDKRYMILTYRAEFDKVHYPLPLALDERSEEDVLRAMVARLRSELAQAQEANKAQKPPPPQHLADDERVSKLHLQNQQLPLP